MMSTRLKRAVLTVGAVASVALLLYAFALAPALHRYGDLHDPQACAICTMQATGSVAPPPAAAVPNTVATGLHAPRPPVDRPAPEALPTIPARGPPGGPMDLT